MNKDSRFYFNLLMIPVLLLAIMFVVALVVETVRWTVNWWSMLL